MKRILCFLLTIVLILSLASCSGNIWGDGSGGDKKPSSKSQTITVYCDEKATTYTFAAGEEAKIDVPVKAGYYFAGVYDSSSGGTEYFDQSGNSAYPWSTNNPAFYYARFYPIENLNFSEIDNDEDPHNWHSGKVRWTYDLGDEFRSAIKGNQERKIKVTLSFAASCDNDKWEIGETYLTNLQEGGEKFNCFTTQVLRDYYTTFSFEYTISARLLKEGKLYLYVNAPYTVWGAVKYHVKNVAVTARFTDAA